MKFDKEAFQNRDIPRRSTAIVCGLLAVCVFLLAGLPAKAAAFLNLDFESSPSFPSGDYMYPFTIYADALPGWTVHYRDTIQNGAWANEFLLDSPGVALFTSGPSSGFRVIEGEKSVFLQSTAYVSYPDPVNPSLVAISQIGAVPIGSQSLRFKALNAWGADAPGAFHVRLGGTSLSLIPTLSYGSGSNYVVVEYAANVSPWAGQTAELSITVLPLQYLSFGLFGGAAFLDSITFSPSPVPEPSAVALIGLSGLCLLRFCHRKTVKDPGTK